MTVWGALVAFTVVTALAHAAIAATVVRGPSRTRLRSRGPAVVTAAVLLTSAAHHGLLAATLLVADPVLRGATPRGLPGPWAVLAVDAAAAVTGLWYLGTWGRPGMRGPMGRWRPDGVLLHPPAMFGAAVLDAAPDATMITDLATGELVWTSRDPWEMVGWSPGEAARRGAPDLRALVVEADRVRVRASDAEVADLDDGESVILRFRVHAPGGGHLWLSRRTTPFARDRSGVARQALSVVRDVSAIVDAEHRLEHAALHDPLTGLPNRSLLHDRLTSAVRRAARAGTEVVVLFCDLDGFKHVNDTEGHAVGDAVLVEVARRLGEVVRGSDTVARVGGDEFVVVVEPPVDDPHPPREVAGLLAERIRTVLSEPFLHAGTATRSRPASA